MDLYAYMNIDSLQHVASENGIDVPRLRGYRMMNEENRVLMSKEDYAEFEAIYAKQYISSNISRKDRRRVRAAGLSVDECVENEYIIMNPKYSESDDEPKYLGVRWDKIHGKLRKRLKLYIKTHVKRWETQIQTFNKYCGRDDVLYIHARIGGYNWPNYYKSVVYEPWFIEKVDDCYDDTYCDIYARIMPVN